MTDIPMLGVDYGERRIGLAVSSGPLAVPLSIVEHTNRAADLERVAAAARDQHATRVVIGLPLHMSGDESEQSRRTRRFGDALARRLDVPVVYADERYSSVRAADALDAAPVAKRGSTTKRRLDDVAAAMILQAYIDGEHAAPAAVAGDGSAR